MSDKKPPSYIVRGKNLAEFVWKVLTESGDFKELMLSDQAQKQRMDICKACESYEFADWLEDNDPMCLECGCILKYKVMFSTDSCPLKKWDKQGDEFINEKFDKLAEKFLDKEEETD